MAVAESDVAKVVAYCRENLGDPARWYRPDGYPNSLALCIIDSIYSTGSHYNSVKKVIHRYWCSHGFNDWRSCNHGARRLLKSISQSGGPRDWATTRVENLKPAHTRPGALLKAEVVQQAASLMVELNIDSVDDLKAAVAADPMKNEVHRRWKRLPSQSSGVTYNYLLILAGLPSVKPDRMVLRFLENALGTSDISYQRAVDLITSAAEELGVDARLLDHAIWRFASEREVEQQAT